ncbi:MAG: hypothetical protein HN403_15190 [Rhodospirillales bacterium]|jgi:hypothetical protein|nr:hypothetical protein [Rhodospirillales bacterium]
MPFVKRDEENGEIVGVFHQPMQEGLEEVDSRDPELSNFLYDVLLDYGVRRDWISSDLSLVRVLEDLVDTLIENGTFMFTDLPDAAQEKLRGRRGLRKEFAYVETLFGSSEDGMNDAAIDFGDDEGGGDGIL